MRRKWLIRLFKNAESIFRFVAVGPFPMVGAGIYPGSAMTLKLTFNKPMMQRHFDETTTAVRIKIENGVVSFLPVSETRGKDVLVLSPRKRGGTEAIVEGTMAEELAAALTGTTPFHTMKRTRGGWLKAVPWTRDVAPPKPEPHVRTWSTPTTEMTPVATVPALVEVIQRSKAIIENYETERRVGRPSREVTEAKQSLAMFHKLVEEIMPKQNTELVIRARELLEQATN